jgi:hypothetical protein
LQNPCVFHKGCKFCLIRETNSIKALWYFHEPIFQDPSSPWFVQWCN